MEEKRKPEVLAPAGDRECLEAAVRFGADAVYLGGTRFGMRASPKNFDRRGLRDAVAYCHAHGVKTYVTCNTLPRNEGLAELPAYLRDCQDIGVDALIVTDLGVLQMAKQYAPKVALHVSTQMGVVNYAAAAALYDLGASRVVMARELSMKEIREIRAQTPEGLMLEAFVHGAMCMSYSGRCLLSNYMTGRDANQGACAQPCRWSYDLVERKRPGERYTLVQEEQGSFILNAKDLNMIRHIPALLEAGVHSLKIEGRGKSAYYVACTTGAYRQAVDFALAHPGETLPERIFRETLKLSHRPYSTGFYFDSNPGQSTGDGGYIRDYELVAVCLGQTGNRVKLKQRNRFFRGERADLLQPSGTRLVLPLTRLYNAYGEEIEAAPHAEMTVYLETAARVEPGSYLRVRRSPA